MDSHSQDLVSNIHTKRIKIRLLNAYHKCTQIYSKAIQLPGKMITFQKHYLCKLSPKGLFWTDLCNRVERAKEQVPGLYDQVTRASLHGPPLGAHRA